MREYQKFPISNFRIGFNESLEPWLLPRDSYPIVKNAHLYRGVIEKIAGEILYARMSYRKTVLLAPFPDGVTTTFTVTLTDRPATNNITVRSAIDSTATLSETFHYDSDTAPDILNLVSDGTPPGTGTINMTTGDVSVTFNTAPALIGVYNSVSITYDAIPSFAPGTADIMGIKPYYANNGGQEILVFNTRRVAKVVTLSGIVASLQGTDNGVSEIPHEVQEKTIATTPAFNGAAVTFTGTAAHPILPGHVKFELYSNVPVLLGTIVDNGSGKLTGALLTANDSYINYVTGAWTMTFMAAPAATSALYSSICVYGNVFTGDYTNFFSVVNYFFYAFITNNVDPIRYYDGTCLLYLNTNLEVKVINYAPYDISKALHVTVNRERLLLLYPTANSNPEPNDIRWSKSGAPLDWTNAEFLLAPTSEPIRLFFFINTDMIVRFANSERIFRYTQDAFSPFRWDTTNSIFRCDTNYSAINYDKYGTSVGKAAIVASDGVNIQRADEIIPDFTLNDRALIEGPIISIQQTSMNQSYGERFDDFKEGWLCFKTDTPNQSGTPERSNAILAFNYIDDTYAVYDFPLNCLGFGAVTSVDTWGNNFDQWVKANYAWSSFFEDFGSLVDLGGDRNGKVYTLGKGNSKFDEDGNEVPVLFDVLSKNFNPFIEEGQKCILGYVDLFVSACSTTKLHVAFFASDTMTVDPDGNPANAYLDTTLTFATTDDMSSSPQSKVWKRIYVGAVAKEHTIRFYQDAAELTAEPNQPVRIHAMILYMKPAGMIFT